MNTKEQLIESALSLLQDLIRIPSFSTAEDATATCIQEWLEKHGVSVARKGHNIYAYNRHFDPDKPSLLLNSHHDTVQPNQAYTRDPFEPVIEDGKLFGLGSNDAGGPLVSLLATFVYFYERENLGHNLVMVASAEEENSGPGGLNSMLPHLPDIDLAIVGEPTLMQMAIAEKGLVVFDAIVQGTPSHAAHPNTDNPIYKCIEVLEWFRTYQFPKTSETLGPVKMTVTQIKAGSQHNVVPSQVDLVVDVRVNDCYSNREIADKLEEEAPCTLKPRSLRHNSSSIPADHPLVLAGLKLGRSCYGSPTLSDQAVLRCPSLKMGPGDSTRSHSANEYIGIDEVQEGIRIYTDLLEAFLTHKSTAHETLGKRN